MCEQQKRPTVNDLIIEAAAIEIAAQIGADPGTLADHYSYPMDGYQIAQQLDRACCGWDLTMREVEILDGMTRLVHQMLRFAEKEWAEATQPQQKYGPGTRIKEGVIHGVCQHSAAKYLVKENGCTRQDRFLLVNFEDAEVADA